MARLPRYIVAGQPQHVIQRGTNRSVIFAADTDYKVFRDCLTRACDEYVCHVHAYVFMTNHVHVLITPESSTGISRVMHAVGTRYVSYFNRTYGRTGALWEGRYRATLIDSDFYLLRCYRYIELNPVRAGRVENPGEYAWSSHAANAFGTLDPLITPHEQYTALGADAESRRSAYRALFGVVMDEVTLRHIRESTHKGWALGDSRFRDQVTRLLNRRAYPSMQTSIPSGTAAPPTA